jgi:hypothetical protein
MRTHTTLIQSLRAVPQMTHRSGYYQALTRQINTKTTTHREHTRF